ncbi:MAG: LysR family transcriptional regulator [Pseudomonadota bacterium]
MELRQLRHFLEIVDSASFCKAAEKLHITQPALSKSMRNLEDSLGVKVLDRLGSGVSPNAYGEVLYKYATLVTQELRRAVDEIDDMRGKGAGVVRVGAGVTILKYFLPWAIRSYISAEEGSSVHMRQGLRSRLLAMLRRGELDLVVASVDPSREEEDLYKEILFEDKLTVVASKNHPMFGRAEALSLEDLSTYKWVLPDTTSEPEGDRIVTAFKRAQLTPPQIVVRTGSSIFMATLLRDTDYLSYLPQALIESDPEFSHLAPLNTESIWEKVHLGVYRRRKGVLLPPVQRFLKILRSVAAEAGPNAPERLESAHV